MASSGNTLRKYRPLNVSEVIDFSDSMLDDIDRATVDYCREIAGLVTAPGDAKYANGKPFPSLKPLVCYSQAGEETIVVPDGATSVVIDFNAAVTLRSCRAAVAYAYFRSAQGAVIDVQIIGVGQAMTDIAQAGDVIAMSLKVENTSATDVMSGTMKGAIVHTAGENGVATLSPTQLETRVSGDVLDVPLQRVRGSVQAPGLVIVHQSSTQGRNQYGIGDEAKKHYHVAHLANSHVIQHGAEWNSNLSSSPNGANGWTKASVSGQNFTDTVIFSTNSAYFDHVDEPLPEYTYQIDVEGSIRIEVGDADNIEAIRSLDLRMRTYDDAGVLITNRPLSRGPLVLLSQTAQNDSLSGAITAVYHLGFSGFHAVGSGNSRRPAKTWDLIVSTTSTQQPQNIGVQTIVSGSVTARYKRPIADIMYNGRPTVIVSGMSTGQTLRVAAGISLAITPDAQRMALAAPRGDALAFDPNAADTVMNNVAVLFPNLFTSEEYEMQVRMMQGMVANGDAFSFKKLKKGIKLAKRAAHVAEKFGVPGANYATQALKLADKGAGMLPEKGNVPFTGRAYGGKMYSPP
jgi:hypothetical protein